MRNTTGGNKTPVPNSLLVKEILDIKVNDTPAMVEFVIKNDKSFTKVTLATLFSRPLTSWDRAVMNEVCSIYDNATNKKEIYFTPHTVINGLSGRYISHPSLSMIKSVSNSLEKLAFVKTVLEIYQNENDTIPIWTATGALLPLSSLEKKGSDRVFKLLEKPVLYHYSQQLNQVLSVPTDIWKMKKVLASDKEGCVVIGDNVNMTFKRIVILQRAVVRVQEYIGRKKGSSLKNTITYDDLYNCVLISEENNEKKKLSDKEKRSINEFTESYVFPYLMYCEKMITGYEVVKKNCKHLGIKFYV